MTTTRPKKVTTEPEIPKQDILKDLEGVRLVIIQREHSELMYEREHAGYWTKRIYEIGFLQPSEVASYYTISHVADSVIEAIKFERSVRYYG